MNRIEKRDDTLRNIIRAYLGGGLGENLIKEQQERTIAIADVIEESVLARLEELIEKAWKYDQLSK